MAPLASIIVNNYNYARFLRDAIDPALAQTHPHIEVIVVDDGSTDESRDIIATYDDRVVPVFKGNGGQDSAMNAGFAASRGEVICFLDSDDRLEPTAIEKALPFFDDPGIVKVRWPLWAADERCRKTGRLIPSGELPEGDVLDLIVRNGPCGYVTSGINGVAWARRFLEQVFPVRVGALRSGGTGEAYLSMLAPLFGRIARISEPLAFYRMHGGNNYRGRELEKLELLLRDYERDAVELQRRLNERGIKVDPAAWRDHSWFHRLHRAVREIESLVPPGAAFILVDPDELGIPDELDRHRRRIPFLECDGQYWGRPADDATAIRELERLRGAGATFLVFHWLAFWWLEHYAELHRYLRERFHCLLDNERLVVFDLR